MPALQSKLPTRKKSDEASEKYHVELEKEEQRLQKFKEVIAMYQQHACIAREATNKQNTDKAPERYRIEFEKEAKRLQRVQDAFETCQQRARIAREAAVQEEDGRSL